MSQGRHGKRICCKAAWSGSREFVRGEREAEKMPIKNQSPEVKTSGVSGAATRIRTGDLILTKDVLYQLSHSSMSKDISS